MHSCRKQSVPAFCETPISVLGYQEDGEWVALALEMDLRGYGDTFETAMDDLKDHVLMQISFALQKGDPEMIFHPAEATYFREESGKPRTITPDTAANLFTLPR